jgi:hypothetical protein
LAATSHGVGIDFTRRCRLHQGQSSARSTKFARNAFRSIQLLSKKPSPLEHYIEADTFFAITNL